ncbi:hypothetical protein HUT19_35935 [Streptomyces sp. NA02950]|nr:hypothetical protein HUT19_35935 [Streptomyces sp. NA02950]
MDPDLLDHGISGEPRVVADLFQSQRLAPYHPMRTVAVATGHHPARLGLGGVLRAEADRAVGHRGGQTREVLTVLVDEVDHRIAATGGGG